MGRSRSSLNTLANTSNAAAEHFPGDSERERVNKQRYTDTKSSTKPMAREGASARGSETEKKRVSETKQENQIIRSPLTEIPVRDGVIIVQVIIIIIVVIVLDAIAVALVLLGNGTGAVEPGPDILLVVRDGLIIILVHITLTTHTVPHL